jgi:hypothetical protein
MRKKINIPSPSLNSPELKAVVERIRRKEPELVGLLKRSGKPSLTAKSKRKERINGKEQKEGTLALVERDWEYATVTCVDRQQVHNR